MSLFPFPQWRHSLSIPESPRMPLFPTHCSTPTSPSMKKSGPCSVYMCGWESSGGGSSPRLSLHLQTRFLERFFLSLLVHVERNRGKKLAIKNARATYPRAFLCWSLPRGSVKKEKGANIEAVGVYSIANSPPHAPPATARLGTQHSPPMATPHPSTSPVLAHPYSPTH